ncbi:response regulator transcription factor [Dyadobacter chenhuakuii]|uniref:Response regulator transcription factor n=1 Tax=Dyadobacter chenhuakuii TaxID=2909339 RepID=A0ABY4XML4_9BACT|nr:response regulator transcription factor [Dyadobacter chenhuakuii]MCF2494310.1 response regulator transcription factor [Dyadobacter chenhuakuii]USJ31434.1 response regulator transcription factor [Dyadobacter chenhuakuii]
MKTPIAIVDDHELVARALSGLIQKFDNYDVIYEVFSGEELMQRMRLNFIPEIILLDVSMPDMDGYQVAHWLRETHPDVKVLALSMNDKEDAIVKMLRHGARGYLLKGCKPSQLRQALDAVCQKGFYYSDFVTKQLINNLNPENRQNSEYLLELSDKELKFIRLSCSDLTYHQIADKMSVSPRTIDGYRESVFQKMDVKSRVGMVLFAIKFKLVDL